MNTSTKDIKKLREETQAPILKIKEALTKAKGDFNQAKKELEQWAKETAVKKQGQVTSEGLIEAYVHTNGKIASLVVLTCQTDFVARTSAFKNLAHELALQVASMNPQDIKALLAQPYIKDPKKTIQELLNNLIAKLGENIEIKKIIRVAI